jgi:predicted nuclease with RNAse H fold
VKIAFGLDLGGYGKKGGTILAALAIDGENAEVGILTDSPFANKLKGASDLTSQIEEECMMLLHLAARGPVAVDVPIDLQGLPSPPDVRRVWELTRRPIDRAFGGLAPLADKLGYCVARFLSLLKSSGKLKIGESIYETYPAASLNLCGIANTGYKRGDESSLARSKIADKLRISGCPLTHDELDAVICALTAGVEGDEVLETDALREEMLRRLGDEASPNRHDVPKGFRLLRRPPSSFHAVRVERYKTTEWLERRL